MKSLTDRELIEGCLRKDPIYQQKFYERFYSKMYAVCKRYSKPNLSTADICQEGFIKAFNNLDKYSFKGSLEGWMRAIMNNRARDLLRKKKYSQEVEFIYEQPEKTTDPEVEYSLEYEYMLSQLEKIPPGYRTVFKLFAIQGYNHKEIAEKLGFQESTSRSQYTKARKMLRKTLEAAGV